MTVGTTVAQYWDIVPAVIGGVIGALAGGVPAWLIAKRQSNETLARDREQRKNAEKALAFGSSVKLLTIVNSLFSLNNHVQSCMAIRQQPGRENMQPWQVLIPMVGHTDEGDVRFSAEEMAVFAAAGEYDYMQDMMLLALRHASSLETFRQYCQRRDEFGSVGPVPEVFEGAVGSAWLTQEQVNAFLPYTIPLNNIAIGLRDGLIADIQLARAVMARFDEITCKYFKVAKFVAFNTPDEAELAAMQRAPENL